MTKEHKGFDSVEMKNRIQAEILAEKAEVGDAEIARRRSEWLEQSSDPLAIWWRSVVAKRQSPCAKARRKTL